jgi:hypothetical protein
MSTHISFESLAPLFTLKQTKLATILDESVFSKLPNRLHVVQLLVASVIIKLSRSSRPGFESFYTRCQATMIGAYIFCRTAIWKDVDDLVLCKAREENISSTPAVRIEAGVGMQRGCIHIVSDFRIYPPHGFHSTVVKPFSTSVRSKLQRYRY